MSLGHDGSLAMCSCDYADNTWLNVLSNFIWAFQQSDPYSLSTRFKLEMEENGILSLDVGYTTRIQCGAPVAAVYPGTLFAIDVEELHKFARNLFWPQVRQKLNEVCVPGRVALQLLCLHAELARRNSHGAEAYAYQLRQLYPLIQGCVQGTTPWPLPGLDSYLEKWVDPQLPPHRVALNPEQVQRLSWNPDKRLMRGKLPHESDGHYFPCVPLMDPACFPPGTPNLHMSCEHCCDPGRGPQGEAACFVGEWSFTRCCRTPNNQGRFW